MDEFGAPADMAGSWRVDGTSALFMDEDAGSCDGTPLLYAYG